MESIIDVALQNSYQCSHQIVGSQSMLFEYNGAMYYSKHMEQNIYHIYKKVTEKKTTESGRGKSKTIHITEEISWKKVKEILHVS